MEVCPVDNEFPSEAVTVKASLFEGYVGFSLLKIPWIFAMTLSKLNNDLCN